MLDLAGCVCVFVSVYLPACLPACLSVCFVCLLCLVVPARVCGRSAASDLHCSKPHPQVSSPAWRSRAA
jgi:hypothetical protein